VCRIQETNDRVCLARSGRTLNQCELCLGLELCSGGGCSKDRTELGAVVSVFLCSSVGCDLEETLEHHVLLVELIRKICGNGFARPRLEC
jgi:hypothetical protein